MRNTIIFSALLLTALAVLLVCGALAVVSDTWLPRAVYGGISLLVAFLLGLGIGERSNTAYCRSVEEANRRLGEQNQELLVAKERLHEDPARRFDCDHPSKPQAERAEKSRS